MRRRKRVMLVGAARPNFVKLASLFSALQAADSFELIFVHTGQHYDEALGFEEVRAGCAF